jgi:hypothetical protein
VFGFPEVVFCDTEYGTRLDGRVAPRCAVFLELYSSRETRLWEDDLAALEELPFDVRNSLFVCYSAGAEIGVFLELGLALPHHVCDLYAESLAVTNGRRRKDEKVRLIDMMARYKLDAIDFAEKTEMRELAMHGGPYATQEKAGLLDYCASDVYSLKALLLAMEPDLRKFHIREILFRGRFVVALARSHRVGTPVDVSFLHDLTAYRSEMCLAIATAAEETAAKAAEADPVNNHRWGIYDGARFTMAGYKDFLDRAGITVPLTKTGQPTTAGKVLERLEGAHPQLAPLRECMNTLDALSKFELEIDTDGCCRPFARPFGSVTGRSTKSIFGLPKWMRPIIRPRRGWGVGYLDAKAQEHLISGTLSGDRRMIADYLAGDVHEQLVKELALTEEGGQKPRDRAKVINHATNYGQKKWGLAKRLGITEEKASEILQEHERPRRRFYQWRQSVVNGLRHKPPRTYFTKLGWPFWTGHVGNARTMMNFPAQAHGADWMRVVMIAATEAGILVCASAHDGFLITAPVERLEADIECMTLIMQAASEALFGIPMFVDCDKHARAVWPNRLVLGGELHPTWKLVQRELRRVKQRAARAAA